MTLVGPQGNRWQKAYIDIPEGSNPYTVRLIGKVGKSHLGDIAIDDIKITSDSSCFNFAGNFITGLSDFSKLT